MGKTPGGHKWDNTAIVVKDEALGFAASEIQKAGIDISSYSPEEAREIIFTFLMIHEATHAILQDSYNSKKSEKTKDGKYKKTTKNIPYTVRPEEKEANEHGEEGVRQYDENRNN